MKNFFILLLCLMLNVISTIGAHYKMGNFMEKSGLYFQDMGDIAINRKSYRIIIYLNLNNIVMFDNEMSSLPSRNCDEWKSSICITYTSIIEKLPSEQNRILQNLGIDTDVFRFQERPIHLHGDFNIEDRIIYAQLRSNTDESFDYVNHDYSIRSRIYQSSFGSTFPHTLKNMTQNALHDWDAGNFKDLFYLWQKEMKKLEEAVHLAKKGQIDPSILTPTILKNALKYATDKFSDVDVPLKLFNYNDIISISNSKISIQNGQLIYDVEVPMIKKDRYRLFRLVPWPMKLENQDTYFFVEPTEDFIAIKAHHHSYIPFKEYEIQNCMTSQERKFCSVPSTMIDLDLPNTCESALISNRRDDFLSICTVKLIKFRETVWHRLDNENSWIFTASQDSINISCTDEPSIQMTLNDSGWIKLNSSCVLVTSNMMTLKPLQKHVETEVLPKSNLFGVNVGDAVEIFLKNLQVHLDQIEVDYFAAKAHLDLGELKLMGTALDTIKKKTGLKCNHIWLWCFVVVFSLSFICYALYKSSFKYKMWGKRNSNLSQALSWRKNESEEESIADLM